MVLKKEFIQSTFIIIGAFLICTVLARPTEAAFLLFDPESSEIEVGETFTVSVNIDAGTQQVAATDIRISYDSSVASLQSVTGEDSFPIVSNVPETDNLYISGIFPNQGEYKTGIGTVATLVFKGEKEGTTALTFDCDLTQTETTKIIQNDINASNIIDCSKLEPHTVTVSDGDSATAAGSTPSTLPASGVYDSMVMYASLGGLLLVVGFGLRILTKVF